MTQMDPEAERQRLAKLYAGLSDGELKKVGEDPGTLTESAFQTLQLEMARRQIAWPGENLLFASARQDQKRLEEDGPVVLRVYRDMPEAMTDRMVLDAAGMDCYLYEENMVRLDWLWSNLLGGVKLVVRRIDAEDAHKLLSGGSQENFTVEGIGEYKQERCPRCHSLDVSCDELKKRIAGVGLLLGLPIAMTQRGWNCHDCGHTWEVAEEVKPDRPTK